MAIDNTGINAGAQDITYSGNEGPKSPEENKEIASAILGDEIGEVASQLWNGMSPSEKSEWRSIEGFIQSEDFKIILMQLQSRQQGRGGLQMASAADPMLQDEYDKYVIEMQEQGMEPMSFEDFKQQAVAGMATGGRAGYKNGGYRGRGGHDKTQEAGKSYKRAKEVGGEKAWQERALQTHRTEQEEQGKGAQQRAAEERAKQYKTSAKGKVSTFLEDRTKAMFNASLLIPGQTKRIAKYRKDYKDYLISMGITPPSSLDDEDLSNFFVNDAFNYEPGAADAGMPEAMNYGDFLLERFDNPTVKYRGDLGAYKRDIGLGGDGPVYYPGYVPPGTAAATATTKDEVAQWQAPEIPTESIYFAADGGRMGYAGGGIADLRQGYFLGKLVKKITRPIKKILKSPIGKIGLGILGAKFLGPKLLAGYGGENAFLKALKGGKLLGETGIFRNIPGANIFRGGKGYEDAWNPWKLGIGAAALYPLIAGMGKDDEDDDFTKSDLYKRWLAQKQQWDQTFAPVGDPANWQSIRYADGGRIGFDSGGSASERYEAKIKELMDKGLSRELAEALVISEISPDAYTISDKKDGGRIGYFFGGLGGLEDLYSKYISRRKERGERYNPSMKEYERWVNRPIMMGQAMPEGGLDEIRRRRAEQGTPIFAVPAADGGRIGYAGGKLAHKTAYLKSLYNDEDEDKIQYAQEGGLMDMGGMEKDYRNEGGFVPIGGEERADDVPARLSKNEFVFTADAVRNAGGGDIDKGAEIMENVMENLEKGGNVSEESQGLEGARNMFATAQRLEGVL